MARRDHLQQQPRIIAGDNTFPIGLLEDDRRAEIPMVGEKWVLLRPILTNARRNSDNLLLACAVQTRLLALCTTEARGA